MWSNWQYLIKIKPYQRLGIALGLSFFVHLFLLGELGFNLPDFNEDRQLIEARLVTVKPMLDNKAAQSAPSKAVLSKPKPPKSPKLVQTKPELKAVPTQTPVLESPPVSDRESSGELLSLIEPATSKNYELSTPPLLQQDAVIPNASEEAAINPNAYKYVETEFDVRTELDAKVDASSAGKAKIVYQLLPNGEQYQLKSLIQAKGLLALLMPDLLQTSDGFLTSIGLQPQHYLYQFGDKKNKTFSADFDWERKALTLHGAKGDQKLALIEGTQDLLSFMYQFMFIPPLQTMQLSITNGKKLVMYDYAFEGEETIPTKMGNLNTIHLLRRADEGEEKTELWLALDYQYVPVKIRKTEKEGKVYELLVTSLKTDKPFSPP
jgi:hypothetical protein